MSEAKRYEAVHLRYEESNIRYGEGCEVEVVAAYDFDTLVQRLQEAERLLRRVIGYEHGPTLDAMIDAFLSGKGNTP